MKYIFALLLSLFSFSAFAQSECVSVGGYPWAARGCVRAQDLTKAIELSPGTAPPSNALGVGANMGKQWLDTRTTPYVLRMCRVATCSSTYSSAEWATVFTIDPATGVITYPGISSTQDNFIPTIYSTSGTLAQCVDLVCIWNPISPANTTLPLNSTPVDGERHIITSDYTGTAYTLTVTSAQSLRLVNGSRNSFVFTAPGQSVTFSYSQVLNSWGIE